MQYKLHLTDQVTQVFIIDPTNITDPFMSVRGRRFDLLTHWEGERSVDERENYFVLGLHLIYY